MKFTEYELLKALARYLLLWIAIWYAIANIKIILNNI